MHKYGMAYGKEFRKKVFEIKLNEGLTNKQLAKRFGIHDRTICNWKNNPEPKRTKNKPAIKIDMKKLEDYVKKHSDAYQYEIAEVFNVSKSAIGYALKRLGISNKKKL